MLHSLFSGTLRAAGRPALVAYRTLLAMPQLRLSELLRSISQLGTDALPLAAGLAAIIGATVILQAGIYADRFGARLYTGWAAGYALFWEFGPLLLGIVMSARIGARNAAELSLLKLGQQIEALDALGIDPYPLLIAPRVIAQTVCMTLLATVVFAVAVVCETLTAPLSMGLPLRTFLSAFADMLFMRDVAAGLAKSFSFGLCIALISTAQGLASSGGAQGVGKAASRTVVFGCATIFAADLALMPVLTRVFGP
jgi:phospholipid/cholesterol/gamma-HCH transport system permease protein